MGETTSPFNAGFRRIDRDGMLIGLWYPTEDGPETVWPQSIHHFHSIENAGAVSGTGKLIAMSHGTGGWFDGHHDTAEALARAGYWVVAPTHPHDNVDDTSGFGGPGQLIERPAHIRRALSAALEEGPKLDRDQLGFFGFSAGGYTGLCLLGGRPVFERLGVLSNEGSTLVFPDDIAERNRATIESGRLPEAEPRIAAAVIAAPAIAYLFSEESIRAIETPTLLLIPEHDEVLPRAEHTEPMLAHWPQPERIVDVPVPSHYSFVAPIDEALITEDLEEVFRDPPGFDRRPFHREMNARITAFFRENL